MTGGGKIPQMRTPRDRIIRHPDRRVYLGAGLFALRVDGRNGLHEVARWWSTLETSTESDGSDAALRQRASCARRQNSRESRPSKALKRLESP